jgi:hypothetical protein
VPVATDDDVVVHRDPEHSGQRAPLLPKGGKRESIYAGLEFIWEISADILVKTKGDFA